MKNFRTLDLAKALYKEGQKIALKGEMAKQFEKASLSVVLNIAEGNGKEGQKERRRFFIIALGSLREVQACLNLIEHPLAQKADHTAASLYRLIQNPGTGLIPEAEA